MEVDSLNLMGIIALFLVVIISSILVIQSQGMSLTKQLPAQLQNTFTDFVNTVLQKSPYNICEAYSGKEVSIQDFQTILQAVYQGQCGDTHANISLTFSLTKDDISRIVKLSGLAQGGNLIFYNFSRPLGVGALIIQSPPGYYVLKTYDFVDIWQQGSPTPDTFLNKTIKGCDPTDEICDEICIYKRVCDPVCETNTPRNVLCNMACIDSNKNRIVDIDDADLRIAQRKCNLDCYSDTQNPWRAYDPGCVWKFRNTPDGICDPNSNGVKDGICDPDCPNDPKICDPDCDGKNGNLYDQKCFVCDKTCNGWCGYACTVLDRDSDCPKGFSGDREECCGNGICNTTLLENCDTCSRDCPGNPNAVCCLGDSNADDYGYTMNKDKSEGGICFCNNQCFSGLKCDETKHCCPDGKTWNGTACHFQYTFTMLYIQVNGKVPNLEAEAQAGKNLWVKLSPLKACPDKIRAIAVTGDSKVCNVDECDPFDAMIRCIDQWGYLDYTRLIGVVPKDYVCRSGYGGLAGGYGSPMLTAERYVEDVSSHEMGHTFGTCDEDYGSGPCQQTQCQSGWCTPGGGTGCSSVGPEGEFCCPNHPEINSIYCSTRGQQCGRSCTYAINFAPSSYAHLEKELNKYCQ
ncbi:MAG: hypothetical protein V1944_00395 [Candidatus Aenigmatarchaeota archaeon]